MNEREQRQNDMVKNQKRGFLSGLLSYFPSWGILISAVFGFWSMFYVLGQLQGRHLFILTLSDPSAAMAIFVGHVIFFMMFLGMLFIVPYGLFRELALKEYKSDLKWCIFAVFFFCLVMSVILLLAGIYAEKYCLFTIFVFLAIVSICIWCHWRENMLGVISDVKSLWSLILFSVIGGHVFIIILFVGGKSSLSDLNWELAISIWLIWWVFLLGSICDIPKKMSFVEGMSFLSLFIMLAVIICLVLAGFAFVRSVYPWLGITQTKNDAQLYRVREEFFDNQVTKNRLSQDLLDRKKSAIKKEDNKDLPNNIDIKNYFDKPLNGYLAWNLGSVVVFCEVPKEGESYDEVLVDCRASSDEQNNIKGDIDLSKGLMIERKYLQMLPK